MMARRRVWSVVALLGVSVAAGTRAVGAAEQPPHVQAYNIIKGIENQFPIPTPRAEVNVGTFDASSGQFTGLVSTIDVIRNPVTNKPMRITIPPVADVNAVAVTLRFTAQNGPVTFKVTPIFGPDGPGATIQRNVAAWTSATIDVGRATRVNWTATSGPWTYSDAVVISRPKIVGAGAFIIPALPVALVYEPPSTSGENNSQTYTVEHSIGTAIRTELTQENSTTTPGTASKFQATQGLKSQLSALATLLQKGGGSLPAVGSALNKIGGALDLLAGGFGETSASDTVGSVHTQVTENELKVTVQRAVTPSLNLGPGRGDVIVVLINARLVWLAEDGLVTLSLLGFDGTGTWSMERLRTQPGTVPVDAATIQELLKLDPFVASGPVAAPPSPRFTYEPYESVSGAEVTISLSHQVTQTDLTATTNYSIRTEDYREGWLSFVGIGVDETKKIMAKMTHRNSTAVTVGSSTTAEITLSTNGFAEFNIYFDRIFNTFAVTRRITRPPVLGGIVRAPVQGVLAR